MAVQPAADPQQSLIASLPTLLPDEGPAIWNRAAAALANLPPVVCADYLDWQEPQRRAAVLQLAQQAEAAAGQYVSPQGWEEFMERVQRWSDDMCAKAVFYGPPRRDHTPAEPLKKVD